MDVLDARGRVVYARVNASITGQFRLEAGSWFAGVYTLRVMSHGRIDVVRFIH